MLVKHYKLCILELISEKKSPILSAQFFGVSALVWGSVGYKNLYYLDLKRPCAHLRLKLAPNGIPQPKIHSLSIVLMVLKVS